MALWNIAQLDPTGTWYMAAGQGMAPCLTIAHEKRAYILSDRGTYLAYREKIELDIMLEGDPILFNPYGVIAVNPDKGEHIKVDLANTFIDWLISVPTQEKIGQFGVADFGAPLFTPDSEPWRVEHPAEGGQAGNIPDNAALQITGNVSTESGWTEEEVRAMEAMDVEATNKDGETETYTGVSINALLQLAGVNDGATTVVYVADDGYSAEVALADVQACANCIVAFVDGGGFRIIMPDSPGNVQVKGVVEIQIK